MGVFGSVISERLYIGFNKKNKKKSGPDFRAAGRSNSGLEKSGLEPNIALGGSATSGLKSSRWEPNKVPERRSNSGLKRRVSRPILPLLSDQIQAHKNRF